MPTRRLPIERLRANGRSCTVRYSDSLATLGVEGDTSNNPFGIRLSGRLQHWHQLSALFHEFMHLAWWTAPARKLREFERKLLWHCRRPDPDWGKIEELIIEFTERAVMARVQENHDLLTPLGEIWPLLKRRRSRWGRSRG